VSPRDFLGAVEGSFLHQPGIEIMSLGWPTCILVTNMTAPSQHLQGIFVYTCIYMYIFVCVCVCVCIQDIIYKSTSLGKEVRQENGRDY
jgi:hypothetical protein